MMKIINVVVFTVALVGTWFLAQRELPVAESVHIGIQEDLKRVIGEFVQKNLPNSKNIVFTRFWTETVKKDRVKASFVYSFEDASEDSGQTKVEIEGYAILNKTKESPESVEWSFDELFILNNGVEFKDPVTITSSPGEMEGEPQKK